MKITINTPPPAVRPPKTITLELTEREFAMLHQMAGSLTGILVAEWTNNSIYRKPLTEFTGTEAASFLRPIYQNGKHIVGNSKF